MEGFPEAVGKGETFGEPSLPEQYYVLVTCRDEPHQVALLTRFKAEGLPCRAILS